MQITITNRALERKLKQTSAVVGIPVDTLTAAFLMGAVMENRVPAPTDFEPPAAPASAPDLFDPSAVSVTSTEPTFAELALTGPKPENSTH